MGEYWRFFVTDGPPTFDDLRADFAALDSRYVLVIDAAAGNIADLMYGDDRYAEIELNTPHGDLFLDDVEALRDQLADAPPEEAAVIARIEAVFARAHGMIALRLTDFGIVYQDRVTPIWDRVFRRHTGLLQVDDEAYYDADGVVLWIGAEDDEPG